MRNQDYSILIRELKAGKESAFDSLFRLFYQDLCRFDCSFLNDTMMAEKIQTTLVNTITLWKSQMVLALGIAHSTEAAQAQSQVSDLTNELLRKNAEKLHMASVETAKESERGIVDMETLQKTNADLIQTLDDVMKIQKEGREKRQAAEAEMVRMENDLKAKLLEIQH